MVRQFADPHAFLRELVQNGIDAGATRLVVSISEEGGGVVRTSVDDDGKGMTRAIIEGPLLTLFQSSKEDDETKIGKYGIGFMSVFSTKPSVVEVRTRTREEAWIVRLFGDHSYELSSDDDRIDANAGTVVTLVHTMHGEAFIEHAKLCAEALLRWCRHARVPISLDGREINQPLAVEGTVTVEHVEGPTRIVVGAGAPGSFVGYYNRGLTLFESTLPEAGTGGVHVKIDSPKLAHTLSRDNVRRDATMERTLEGAVHTVRGPLWGKLEAKIASTARDVADSSGVEKGALLASLYEAAAADAFGASGTDRANELLVPLVETYDGALVASLGNVVAASEKALVTSETSTPLTRALAGRGTPVVKLAALGAPLRRLTGDDVGIADAATRFGFASTEGVSAHEGDDALLAELWRLAEATGRTVHDIVFAEFVGAPMAAKFRLVETEAREAIIPVVVPKKRRWTTERTLFVDVDDAAVRLARRRAKSDPVVAAHLLFRAILLEEGPLEAKDVDRLLEECNG